MHVGILGPPDSQSQYSLQSIQIPILHTLIKKIIFCLKKFWHTHLILLGTYILKYVSDVKDIFCIFSILQLIFLIIFYFAGHSFVC